MSAFLAATLLETPLGFETLFLTMQPGIQATAGLVTARTVVQSALKLEQLQALVNAV